MAICRYCREKVSHRARACPHCGEPNPGRRSRLRLQTLGCDYGERLLKRLLIMGIPMAMYFNWKEDSILIMLLSLFGGYISGTFVVGITGILFILAVRKMSIDDEKRDQALRFAGDLPLVLLFGVFFWFFFENVQPVYL